MKDARMMTADTFAREHLGYWPEVVTATTPIKKRDWDACQIDNPTKGELTVYAVKFSPDGAIGTLAVCQKPSEGLPFVYVVESRALNDGIGWFVDELTQRWHKAAQIIIDGQSNAQSLSERLIANKVPKKVVIRPRTSDAVAAYSSLSNAVKEKRINHYGQEALNVSATQSKRRRIGSNGGWGFESTDKADATLIEACALAYWGAMTTKRKPGRKAVVR
jgi:hypothetical protein